LPAENTQPLMKTKQPLGLVLDSWSLQERTKETDKLLMYTSSPLFKWVRSPLKSDNDKVRQIPEYKVVGDSEYKGIQIARAMGMARYAFLEQTEVITELAKELCRKSEVTAEEKEILRSAFIFLGLSRFEDDYHLLVTERPLLLSNRLLLKSRLGDRLRIVSIEEAVQLADLFSRRNDHYYICPPVETNEWYWYWLSFRSKVPYYNGTTRTALDAFAWRFVYLIMSVDAIGVQHYSGVNNDTLERTIYHFNYFLTLIPGIFDSLAITTRDALKITFERDDIPQKTSLSNKIGDDFLRALRDKRPDIRKHINEYVDFINLIYFLRELVIHREQFSKGGYESSNLDKRWEANVVEVPDEVMNLMESLSDRPADYNPFTQWGTLEFGSKYLLVPYQFAKRAVSELIQFSNTYLQLMGFSNFVQSLPKEDDFRVDVNNYALCR
jgi:hypothetical protein